MSYSEEELPDGSVARYIVSGQDASGMLGPWKEIIDNAEAAVAKGDHDDFMESLLQLHVSVYGTIQANLAVMEAKRAAELRRRIKLN